MANKASALLVLFATAIVWFAGCSFAEQQSEVADRAIGPAKPITAKSPYVLIAPTAAVTLEPITGTMSVALSLSKCSGGVTDLLDDNISVAVNDATREILVVGQFRFHRPEGGVPKYCRVNPDNPNRIFRFEDAAPGRYTIVYGTHYPETNKLVRRSRIIRGAQTQFVDLPGGAIAAKPELPEAAEDVTLSSPAKEPLVARHPTNVSVTRDTATKELRITLSLDRCKNDKFVYTGNNLTVDVDHSQRTITVKGSVEYLEQLSGAETACATRLDPIVINSKQSVAAPYLILNQSAWQSRGGNGIPARVTDFRSTETIEAEERACLESEPSEIDKISGDWFLQSDPSLTQKLSGNETAISPSPVLRTWVGSTVPTFIESTEPFGFNLPPFGVVRFRSSKCATVYSRQSGEQMDFLFRLEDEL